MYIHIPSEAKQLQEQAQKSASAASGQFFEEIVRVAVLREQADCFGMQVAAVEHHGRVATESFDSFVLEFAPGPSG